MANMTDWEGHILLVDARALHGPEKPFLAPSTTVEEGLAYLEAGVREMNHRNLALRPWGMGEDEVTVLQLLARSTGRAVSTETYTWRLKKAMANAEIRIMSNLRSIERSEGIVAELLELTREEVKTCTDIETDEMLGRFAVLYDMVEREYIDTDDDASRESRMRTLEDSWRVHTGRHNNPGILEFMTAHTLRIYTIAERVARLGFRFSRQRLITEFFYRVED